MTGFSDDWLALREPADRRARSTTLVRDLYTHVACTGPMRIVDLGAGTGANCRWLIPRGPREQEWQLVDYDAALLSVVPDRMRVWAAEGGAPQRSIESADGALVVRDASRVCRIELARRDLVPFDGALLAGCHVVTASALLDLVSDKWMTALADACRSAGAAALFALSYDGRIDWSPSEADDALVRALVNRHQRTDKGFGVAAGPDAVPLAARVFAAAGYRVERRRSDWILTHEPELQRRLLEGWAAAAAEMAPEQAERIDGWLRSRLGHVEARRSVMTVGHEDLAAWLPGRRGSLPSAR